MSEDPVTHKTEEVPEPVPKTEPEAQEDPVQAKAPEPPPEEEAGREPADLKQLVQKMEQENSALENKYLRAYADFENYKKRATRDQEDLVKYSNERLIREFLPVVDSLERALSHSEDTEVPAKFLEGLTLILKQFQEVLARLDVMPVDSLHQPFDPARHQAISQVETDAHPEGTVAEEIQKGYWIKGRMLRPALVVVSRKKSPEPVREDPADRDTAEPEKDH